MFCVKEIAVSNSISNPKEQMILIVDTIFTLLTVFEKYK